MTLLSVTPNLTGEDLFTQKARGTHAGMAHLAGSGPAGATCKDCSHWQTYGAARIMKAPCGKFQKLMLRAGPAFPGTASACKFWEGRQ